MSEGFETRLEALPCDGSAFVNCDCMEGMKRYPDKYFDLAVVDPPYGDGGGGNGFRDGKRFGERFDRYKQGESGGGGTASTSII